MAWDIVRTNNPSFMFTCSKGKTSNRASTGTHNRYNASKGDQKVATRREIAKKRQLRDESEPESPSGFEESYDVDSLGEPLDVTTRDQDKSKAMDISKRTIPWFLFGSDYEVPTRTLKYDYRIEALKRMKQLSIEDNLMHYWWMENIIVEAKEDAKWVTRWKPISKASLNFLAKP
ncbi:hypothetical protein HAX54_048344 [Datura stramonium]|uniref:Uncharacterized protein n=1 Tax=Datura stramonium TaxID=4076 RepID=A0ABS8SV72_DATST|nr:hypothetical protein [Datura stramonium]